MWKRNSPRFQSSRTGEGFTKLRKFVSLTIVLLLLLGLPHVSAQTTNPQSQFNSIGYAGYFPATLQISFPHTTEISSNVSSYSGGLFTYSVITGQPDSTIRYQLNDSDVYTVRFSATYPVPEQGNMSWVFFSPGFIPQNGEDSFVNSTQITLSFTIELLPQPVFPSSDKIANATAALLLTQLNKMNSINQQTSQAEVASLQQQVDILFGAFIIFAAAVLVVLFVVKRHSGEEQ